MESAYLKSHVGGPLAKAIAETVAAQPANPQEYLALYLLHHLQEEERRQHAVSQQKKAVLLEREWAAQHEAREKIAGETIQRGLANFRARLAAKKTEEAQLLEQHAEAVAEAEDLLDQEEATRQGGRDSQAGGGDGNEAEEGAKQREQLQAAEETLTESRREFYRAQRFLLGLQKSHVGQLKRTLTEFKERVRAGKAAVETIADNTAAEELEAAERDWRLDPGADTQPLSAAAESLAAQARGHRNHAHVSVHHILYRVLRCLCYLVLDATPKATDSATKVAALVKPTVLAATLRSFNPVATYDRARPLRLERNLPASSGGGGAGDEDGDEGAASRGGAGGEGDVGEESVPVPQPKTRQVRRAQRVLRALLADAEYICQLKPTAFFDEELLEHEEGELASVVAAAEADVARAEALRESILAQTKQRGGVVLWALLTYLDSAVRFRQARDAVLAARRELGLDTADTSNPIVAMLEEAPEEEAEDEMNDEALVDEEGAPDVNEVRRLQTKIGVDEDEQLVKLWEAKDERQRRDWEARAAAFRKAAGAGDEEAEEEDADNADDE